MTLALTAALSGSDKRRSIAFAINLNACLLSERGTQSGTVPLQSELETLQSSIDKENLAHHAAERYSTISPLTATSRPSIFTACESHLPNRHHFHSKIYYGSRIAYPGGPWV